MNETVVMRASAFAIAPPGSQSMPVIPGDAEVHFRFVDPGVHFIAMERARQLGDLKYNAARDDAYVDGDLWKAAHGYLSALAGYDNGDSLGAIAKDPPDYWPWPDATWKPAGPMQDLVRAGALIAAEISRRVRAREHFLALIVAAAVEGGADRPYAEATAADVLADYLKDEGVEVGHPHYDWSQEGAAAVAEDYILKHLESEAAAHGE